MKALILFLLIALIYCDGPETIELPDEYNNDPNEWINFECPDDKIQLKDDVCAIETETEVKVGEKKKCYCGYDPDNNCYGQGSTMQYYNCDNNDGYYYDSSKKKKQLFIV